MMVWPKVGSILATLSITMVVACGLITEVTPAPDVGATIQAGASDALAPSTRTPDQNGVARNKSRLQQGAFWPLFDGLEVQVLYVRSGDYLDVEMDDGSTTTVGLLGVEVPGPDESGVVHGEDVALADNTCLAGWGARAVDYVAQLVSRYRVTIILEPHARGKDPDPKLLAYVHVGGQDLNSMLVEQGYARASTKWRATRVDEYLKREGKAKSQGLGLWECQ